MRNSSERVADLVRAKSLIGVEGRIVIEDRRERITGLERRDTCPLPALDQMSHHSVRVGEPPLARAKRQNVVMACSEDARAIKVSQAVIDPVVMLVSGVAEFPVVQ